MNQYKPCTHNSAAQKYTYFEGMQTLMNSSEFYIKCTVEDNTSYYVFPYTYEDIQIRLYFSEAMEGIHILVYKIR